MERDIKGRFLPKNYHWYRMDKGFEVLAPSYVFAIEMYNRWLSYPIEVEWLRRGW